MPHRGQSQALPFWTRNRVQGDGPEGHSALRMDLAKLVMCDLPGMAEWAEGDLPEGMVLLWALQ